jgi:hypothetical protein
MPRMTCSQVSPNTEQEHSTTDIPPAICVHRRQQSSLIRLHEGLHSCVRVEPTWLHAIIEPFYTLCKAVQSEVKGQVCH